MVHKFALRMHVEIVYVEQYYTRKNNIYRGVARGSTGGICPHFFPRIMT
jgi:hypothetical protein